MKYLNAFSRCLVALSLVFIAGESVGAQGLAPHRAGDVTPVLLGRLGPVEARDYRTARQLNDRAIRSHRQLEKRLRRAGRELADLRRVLPAKEAAFYEHQQNLARAVAELDQLRARCAAIDAERAGLANEMARLEDLIHRLDDRIRTLSNPVRRGLVTYVARGDCGALRDRLRRAQRQLDDLRCRDRALAREHRDVKRAIQRLECRANELERCVERARCDLERLQRREAELLDLVRGLAAERGQCVVDYRTSCGQIDRFIALAQSRCPSRAGRGVRRPLPPRARFFGDDDDVEPRSRRGRGRRGRRAR